MLVSKMVSKRIQKRYMQIFYYFTLAERLKRGREISMKSRESIPEFSMNIDIFFNRLP